MHLHVERQPDAESFLERAGPFLLEREAEHNLILGLAGRLRTNPLLYGDEPYFAVVLDDRRVLAAALRTPPRNPAALRTPTSRTRPRTRSIRVSATSR